MTIKIAEVCVHSVVKVGRFSKSNGRERIPAFLFASALEPCLLHRVETAPRVRGGKPERVSKGERFHCSLFRLERRQLPKHLLERAPGF